MAVKIVSPKAELAVLRGMTHKNKVIAGTLLSSVNEAFFDAPESKEIFKALKSHMAKTGEAPTFRLMIEDPELSKHAREYFRDSQATITTVEDANKAVRILNRFRQLRGLYELGLNIDQVLQSTSPIDMEKVLGEVGDKISLIRVGKQSNDSFLHFGKNNSSNDLVKDMLFNQHSEDTIPTGIKEFDEQSGGLMRGSLVTVGASSGGGKSLFANVIGTNMAERGYKVAVVPLEMSAAEMTARILAKITGVDVTRILQRRLTSNEQELVYKKYQRWVRAVKAKGGRLTVYKPKGDVDIEDVYTALATYDLDVTIVDYISLLAGTDGDDSWRQLGAIARKGKINAEATGRVNILLAQVSEDGKIRYARAISEHSTNSFIWVASKEEREKPVGRIRVEQPKARNSKSFPFEVGFEWAAMRTAPIPETQNEAIEMSEPMENLAG